MVTTEEVIEEKEEKKVPVHVFKNPEFQHTAFRSSKKRGWRNLKQIISLERTYTWPDDSVHCLHCLRAVARSLHIDAQQIITIGNLNWAHKKYMATIAGYDQNSVTLHPTTVVGYIWVCPPGVKGSIPDSSIDAPPAFTPAKKYSDVSGLPANYTDPLTKLRFADASEFYRVRDLPMDIVNGLLELRKANSIVG
ncbi:INO80 complex subunit C-like [Homarus americanus]|uniref:INO80 complex subunit C-like n=1 Tax=Homarus americanus TaxID=6706 RepID=A0A8J5JVD0_HOMAM|nr:INO80 complex subunit C-like [Homarus americanus]